jgi:hypothetical protein
MSTPVPGLPSNQPTPPQQPSPSMPPAQKPTDQDSDYTKNIRIWQKFLSVGGYEATPEQAKQFMEQMMKSLSSYLQHCNQRMIDAIKEMRKEEQ